MGPDGCFMCSRWDVLAASWVGELFISGLVRAVVPCGMSVMSIVCLMRCFVVKKVLMLGVDL